MALTNASAVSLSWLSGSSSLSDADCAPTARLKIRCKAIMPSDMFDIAREAILNYVVNQISGILNLGSVSILLFGTDSK